MIRFNKHKKLKKNTRHQKEPKDSFKLFILYFFMKRFYTHKKHKKNTRHQKVPKTLKAPKSTKSIKAQPSKCTKRK